MQGVARKLEMPLFHFSQHRYPTTNILLSLAVWWVEWSYLTTPVQGHIPYHCTAHVRKVPSLQEGQLLQLDFWFVLGGSSKYRFPLSVLVPPTNSMGSCDVVIQTTLWSTTVPLEGKVKTPSGLGENVRKTMNKPQRDETLITTRKRTLHN